MNRTRTEWNLHLFQNFGIENLSLDCIQVFYFRLCINSRVNLLTAKKYGGNLWRSMNLNICKKPGDFGKSFGSSNGVWVVFTRNRASNKNSLPN